MSAQSDARLDMELAGDVMAVPTAVDAAFEVLAGRVWCENHGWYDPDPEEKGCSGCLRTFYWRRDVPL